MVDEVMKFITEADPEVGEAIEAEAARQRRNLELIASENIVSEPVMNQQICRGISGKTLLRRMPVCRCCRVHRDRESEKTVWL